jgi:hypothetical protein
MVLIIPYPFPLKSMILLSDEHSSRQVCGTTHPRSAKSSFVEGVATRHLFVRADGFALMDAPQAFLAWSLRSR